VFSRTVCDCDQCKKYCHVQPGHLLPGQMEKIADYLKVTLTEVKKFFWASPGARVMDSKSGLQFNIGTITPRYDRHKKACVFLTDEGQCRIHAEAPYGCAFFDTHMSSNEGQQRAGWGMAQILGDEGYKTLRDSLPFADHYKPKGY
jgi:Fe-S-cluster containining protein